MFRSQDLYVFAFVKSRDFKICDVTIGIAATYIMQVTLMLIYFESTIKVKFGQILVCHVWQISPCPPSSCYSFSFCLKNST